VRLKWDGACHVHTRCEIGIYGTTPLVQLHVSSQRIRLLLRNHLCQSTRPLSGNSYRHRDPYVRSELAIHPWMIGHGEGDRQRGIGIQVALEDAPVEGLAQAIRGDEPEALRLAVSHPLRRLVPRVADEVDTVGDVARVDIPNGLSIAVTQGRSHNRG